MDSLLQRIDQRDRALFQRCVLDVDRRLRSLVAWHVVTHLGGASFTIGVAVAAVIAGGEWRAGGSRALLLLVLSHIIVQGVKRTVGRPRPSRAMSCLVLIGEPDRFSFPSGHAAAAMSIALGFSSAFPAAAPILAPAALVVGFSRVALAVHYPGDVVAGSAIALFTGGLLWLR